MNNNKQFTRLILLINKQKDRMDLLKKKVYESVQRVDIIDLRELIISSNSSNGYRQIIETIYIGNQQQNKQQQLQKEQFKSNQQEQQQQYKKHNHLRQQPQSPNQLQSKSNQQHLLILNFQLLQLQPLTTINQQPNLFTLHCGLDCTITSNLKLSKLFDLDSVNYFMEMDNMLCKVNRKQGASEYFVKAYTKVNTIKETDNQLLSTAFIRHKIQMTFVMNQKLSIENNTTITLIVNNDRTKWPFQIEKFIVYSSSEVIAQLDKNCFSEQMQQPIIKNLSVQGDYSYPLIDRLQLPQGLDAVNKLRNQIDKLQPYHAPQSHLNQSQQQKQLYICHDMKGGYIQDINTFYPLIQSSTNTNNTKVQSYRFNYLSQTKIFNYFSHYPITIPPKLWRQLCKHYNTLCLGTFITEPNDYLMDQDDYVTEQFALKLVYIAKMVGFDGYLINIETPVRNVGRLIGWLGFLTKEMNKAVPGSQIIWYDSIIVPTGEIRYQNALNQYNLPFYQAANGIFTNYWWNQSSLLTSMKHKIKQKLIYIGNDCWGRNTYGGGKHDIYKAVNKIQQLGKGQLSVALFAPGFTYEDNAESCIKTFAQNELKMYHGFNVISKRIEKWTITMNGGQGWKQQGQWAVTSYQLCRRQALVDIKQFQGKQQVLVVTFSCIVAGTGPNFADYYVIFYYKNTQKITLQLYDYKNKMVYHEKTYPNTVATKQEYRVEIRMEIDCEVVTDGMCLRVIEEGKDVEYWAGNFGSRFKEENVVLSTQNKVKNWISTIPIQPINITANQPYITYFNKGQGLNFYFMGNPIQKNYDSLSDYDIPPIYPLNNASDIEISSNEAFIGGSCLRFRNTNKIYLNKFKVSFDEEQKAREFHVKITVKETDLVTISYGQGNKNIIKPCGQAKIVNQWKTYTFQLRLLRQDGLIDIQANFGSSSGLIGEFGIFEKNQKNQLNKKVQLLFKVKIASSKQPKYILPYCVDIMIISSNSPNETLQLPKRLLIKIGQFSVFIHLEKSHQIQSKNESYILRGFINQIPVLRQKLTSFQIELIDINDLKSKEIMKRTVSWEEIKKLTQNKTLSYQLVL